MLFWCKGCCCLEEAAVASIAVFVISLDLESFVDEGSKFKNEDFISPLNWEFKPEATGFVLSVLTVVVFARPEDPNAAVTGGGGGANCGGGGTAVGEELADCLFEVDKDFSCCWGDDDASLPTMDVELLLLGKDGPVATATLAGLAAT